MKHWLNIAAITDEELADLIRELSDELKKRRYMNIAPYRGERRPEGPIEQQWWNRHGTAEMFSRWVNQRRKT